MSDRQRDILERIEAEREARAVDPMRPANPLLREAADEIASLRALCTKFEASVGEYLGEIMRLKAQLAEWMRQSEDNSREIDKLEARLEDANKKLAMADGTLTLERGFGVDTHATMVAVSQKFAAENIRLKAQLASARKALEPFAAYVFNDNGDITVTTSDLRVEHYLQAKVELSDDQ